VNIKKFLLAAKEKSIHAGYCLRDRAKDTKNFVAEKLKKDPEDEQINDQLNKISDLLKKCNTKCDLDDLAKDLKVIEKAVDTVLKKTIKIKEEL
jgi:hypothetical protein